MMNNLFKHTEGWYCIYNLPANNLSFKVNHLLLKYSSTPPHNVDFYLFRYIIRSDPLAHMPEDSQVGQSRNTRNQQDFGTDTRDETHLWNLLNSRHPDP